MKHLWTRWGMACLVAGAMAGCGGGSGDSAVTSPEVKKAIAAASTVDANDTASNTSASFTVVQAAGVPAVIVNSPPQVNFAVFSNRAVKSDLALTNMSFAIAKLVPGNPDQWVNYIYRTESTTVNPDPTKPSPNHVGPGGAPVMDSAMQATTDSKAAATLVYHPEGYYTYTFTTDIKDTAKTNGVVFEPGRTHRVAIQLSYTNAAGETVLVNPYFDFTLDANGKSVPVTDPAKTRKMTDVTSCNGCHDKLGLHGGGRVDTQFCVMCHNPGTTDANSGNVLNLATMVHKIHAGKRLAAAGEDYTIWGYQSSKHSYAEVGFPQDLRNCAVCHSGANPKTPQGDNWKTKPSQGACLTCHDGKAGSAWDTVHSALANMLVGPGAPATALTGQQCADCHKPGTAIAPERVHWNQNEENAAKYKMNIASVTLVRAPSTTVTGQVEVKYFLSDPTNGNAKYKIEDDAAKFGSLYLYAAYQSLVGQSTAVTEFSSYNNGGGNARVTAISGANDGNNVYTNVITIPMNTATSVASGTARIVSIGQIKEPKLQAKWAADPRPEVVPQKIVNTVVQNTWKEFAITGPLNPRRTIVATEKCNVCHGALGTTSGSNTLAEAFHSGARNIVEACVVCHDANRMSSTVMTNGLALNESYQFKRMIHGIHGNSKRTYPFTHGNPVKGVFDKNGTMPAVGNFLAAYSISGFTPTTPGPVVAAGTALAGGATFTTIEDMIFTAATSLGYTKARDTIKIENYAAEVAWPGVGINCNACHVNNSYKQDRGPLGAVVNKPSGTTDPSQWIVISPKAASCTACHDSPKAQEHVTNFGGATFGTKTQADIAALPRETCDDCHASGGFKNVDTVHGQK